MKEGTKAYSNGEITIVWDSSKCQHAAECVRNSPHTFKPKERPWIDAESGSSQEIMSTIDKCPSGALTYHKNSY
jgi:uncharacterized Fe-S cluster protein YjdI